MGLPVCKEIQQRLRWLEGIKTACTCAEAHPHKQTTCVFLSHYYIKTCLLFSKKSQSKSSHFLTPSNYVS